jgi:uncharacterized repeat protein (TIGR01451 family)
VIHTLPAGLSPAGYQGLGWTCGDDLGVLTCTRPSLGTGAAPPIVALVMAPAAGGTLNSTASVSALEVDPDLLDNEDSATTTVTPVNLADLRVEKDDGGAEAIEGQPFTYTILATNNGPQKVLGATVTDYFPADLESVTWTCSATAGSSCAPSGSGDIVETVDLDSGGAALFTATGTVAIGAVGPLENTATIDPPAGPIVDPVPENNSSSVSTDVILAGPDVIFQDGFEGGDTSAWSGSVP